MQAQLFTTFEPLDTGSLVAGRYRIIAKVGEGGFGMVYKARDTRKRHRLVAIKQIDLGALSPRQIIEATDSYNREVTILSRLYHRNLPRIYEHFTDPTHWYLVMQYIEGETLEDYLKRTKEGHLSLKEVCATFYNLVSNPTEMVNGVQLHRLGEAQMLSQHRPHAKTVRCHAHPVRD